MIIIIIYFLPYLFLLNNLFIDILPIYDITFALNNLDYLSNDLIIYNSFTPSINTFICSIHFIKPIYSNIDRSYIEQYYNTQYFQNMLVDLE
jgi:hypothetical protein